MNSLENKKFAGFGLYLMCIGYVAIIPAVAITLFGGYGYPIAILSSSMFFAYYIAKLEIQKTASKIRNWFSFFGLASSIMLKRMNGMPTATAFSDSIKIFGHPSNDVSLALRNLPLAMRLVGFGEAINHIAAKSPNKDYSRTSIIKHIVEKSSSGLDAIGTFSAIMDSAISNLENALSAYNNRNNRNSTVLMLFSTVLPSFALFGIAGYSILSGSASFLPEAFAIFVVSAPIAYIIALKATSVVSNAII